MRLTMIQVSLCIGMREWKNNRIEYRKVEGKRILMEEFDNLELNENDLIERNKKIFYSLIPNFGSSLDILLNYEREELRIKRLEIFTKEIKESIDKNPMIIRNLDDEEFLEYASPFFNKVMERVTKEIMEEKRCIYTQFILKLLENGKANLDINTSHHFLTVIEKITVLEIEVLMYLYHEGESKLVNKIKPDTAEDQYSIVGAVGSLKNFGFIKNEVTKNVVGPGSDTYLFEKVSISSFGTEFIEYIKKVNIEY